MESYAADLAVWLQLTPLQRLAARLYDWSRPRQAPPLQHLAPRSEFHPSSLDLFWRNSSGDVELAWRRPASERAWAAQRGAVAGQPDYVEANEEPRWLYGREKHSSFRPWVEERRAQREEDEERWGRESDWWNEVSSDQTPPEDEALPSLARPGMSSAPRQSSALDGNRPENMRQPRRQRQGTTRSARDTATERGVGLTKKENVSKATKLCRRCHHPLPRCFCVCDYCGIELGLCDCNEKVGISAAYLRDDDDSALGHLSPLDRQRIAHEMTLPGHVAEDREQHTHRQEAEEQKRQQAARSARIATKAQARHLSSRELRPTLPYNFRTATAWQILRSYWGEELPAVGGAGAAHAAGRSQHPRSRARGRPMARPRVTPFAGCKVLYAPDDPRWQARAFRRHFPWGIPVDHIDAPDGWWTWAQREAARDAQWQLWQAALVAQHAQPYETPRAVMEMAMRHRLSEEFAQTLQSLRPRAHEVAHGPSPGRLSPPFESTPRRHITHLAAKEYPLVEAAEPRVVARLAASPTWLATAWIPPEELRPSETGLWLPTDQVATLWGIKRDSVCAWHRDHPEVLTDKNGVRELHFHLEDVVQRANEKAHATDRYFPWRQPSA